MSFNNLAEQWATEKDKRDRLFCDLADATPVDDAFRLSDFIGEIPCIARYAPKTQIEILRALAARMANGKWQGDRIVRVFNGVYRWECRNWQDASPARRAA